MALRTTLTLDDDVAAGIAREVRRTGLPMKSIVNDALRAGLEVGPRRKRSSFRIAPRDLGLRPEIELDDIEGLLDRLDGPDRR